jgi:glycine dehydrogenase subunit 1
MRYLPHTPADIQSMLEAIGASSLDDLFAMIPDEVRLQAPLELPPPLAERALLAHLKELGASTGADALSFLGAGAYPHHIPAALDQLLLRSEFYTAYTPYQPEISQGTLQGIFEFQTLVCQLFGVDVANASLYDAASGTAEALLMADRIHRGKRPRMLLSQALHPDYQAVCCTYLTNTPLQLVSLPFDNQSGVTDPQQLEDLLDEQTGAVVLGYPNFFGCIEPLQELIARCHQKEVLVITVTSEPLSLGLLQPPGAFGADITVGEGQSFGIPLSFGGPYLGLFGCRDRFKRQIPGRLAGRTSDLDGECGYVLTLATREQHIRRERATSNICTNEGLMALAATIYLSLLGKSGLQALARENLARASFARKTLLESGFSFPFSAPTFNEFVLRLPAAKIERLDRLYEQDLLPGLPLGETHPDLANCLLVAVTEIHSRADIQRLAQAIQQL